MAAMRRWPRDHQAVDRVGARPSRNRGRAMRRIFRPERLRPSVREGEADLGRGSRSARPRAASRRARPHRPSAPRRRGAGAPAGSRRRPHHHDQVETALGEAHLQAGQERDEEGLAILLVARMRLQHEGDRMGGAAAQVPARLVRRVVELFGGFEHALPRLGIDVGAPVERPRHGADRNVQVTRKVADAGRQADGLQFRQAIAQRERVASSE